ncbi:MAG: RecQ family ATP-dependent DNA helicase [Kiritimatiellia bacterium]|jgi:ATP-dependent DNA helicase RecQ|nr:RecQ family ATP-dependent DNA helicase [Kiritimatiellia bacterium]
MIKRTLFLDLETDRAAKVVFKAGLCSESRDGGMAWSWEKAQPVRWLEARLDNALFGAAAIAGHNVWQHDLRVLAKQFPKMALLQTLPVIDTLELSPLCFPKNPYHALEKDYKPTGREENDPLGDAVLARQLLWREVEVLTQLREQDPLLYRALHGLCASGNGRMERGYALVFGGPPPAATDTEAAVRECAGRSGCSGAAGRLTVPEGREDRMGLAYVLVWLTVAGDGRSVLPGWVWRNYPQAQEVANLLRDHSCGDPACVWCREQFNGRTQLQRWFPDFADFRQDESGGSLQRDVVEAALTGQSLMAVMPTGGGKSLCFQLPALAKMERRGSLTVVLSPLQSLMKDQVDQLARRSPAARGCVAALNGLLTPLERRDVLHRIAMGEVSLLYVAPEQLRSRSFGRALQQREIGGWVFDEAHCLSKWGHDFRTDYLYAGRFIRERMGGKVPPVMYVTATAKSEVLSEIRTFHKAMTGSEELRLFEASVERPTLQFEVLKVPPGFERMEKIAEVLSERLSGYGRGGAIVFRSTRAKTQATSEFLQAAGWKAEHFHAGLPPEQKKEVQDRFIAGDLQVIAATNAFGMGVDKEDVRVVIHGDMPGSIENYLQEAGRAGRDQRPADCVLMYDENDADWQFNLNGMNRLGRREIAEILRALRKYRRKDGEAIVVTVGELMQDTRLQEVFDAEDRGLNTKVKTALSWLERADYLRRDDNVVSVFQAKPIVRTRQEAEMKAAEAGEPPTRQRLWGDIVNEFAWARPDAGIDADRLLELDSLEAWSREQPYRPRSSRLLFQELRAMSKAKLLRECTTLTAFVRYKVSDPARARLAKNSRIEEALLAIMAGEGLDPQVEPVLDVALANQRLKDEEGLEAGLHGLERVAQGVAKLEADGRRVMNLRPIGATRYRVRLEVDLPDIQVCAAQRREVAAVVLATILERVPADTTPGKDVLSEFTMEQLCEAVEGGTLFRTGPHNAAAEVEAALLWMHDLQILRLQRGLALFRSAMTIRGTAEPSRFYGVREYAPLGRYYEGKTFQVHVMLEYARRGLANMGESLALVLDYFRLDQKSFIERYFPNRKKELEREATAEAYRRVVEELGDVEQRRVVEAPEEENLLVLAGPGSGKTQVVVHRLAWLLKIRHVPAGSILALCFNHDAAVQLRRRLQELVGDAARGVTVMTYHGLAMRLTGTSFSALAGRAAGKNVRADLDFSRPLVEAVRLLKSGDGGESEEEENNSRDRLLAGFRHILVDEYQDVDEVQYDLISALAGRTLKDPDAKLNLLAVGDDDQSIYAFRGASVEFIRRFEHDYKAATYGLTSNYRSSAEILAAAGNLIAGNRNRMKTGIDLHVDRRRRNDPPGEAVIVIEASGLVAQTAGILEQVREWRQAGVEWDRMAVLGAQREDVDAFRGLAEVHEIPFSVRMDGLGGRRGSGLPALWRMRECLQLLEWLKSKSGSIIHREEIEGELVRIRKACESNIWTDLLANILEEFPDKAAEAGEWTEHIYEALAATRRDGRVGRTGIWLSTIHAAKGTEHEYVVVAGRWRQRWRDDAEEARRLLYVGMTRARRGLAIVARSDETCPLLNSLRNATGIRRKSVTELVDTGMLKHYRVLGPADLDLGFAGRGNQDRTNRIAATLKTLRMGSALEWEVRENLILLKAGTRPVAKVSEASAQWFRQHVDQIETIRVSGVYGWRKEDVRSEWRNTCKTDRWGVPLCEVVLNQRIPEKS